MIKKFSTKPTNKPQTLHDFRIKQALFPFDCKFLFWLRISWDKISMHNFMDLIIYEFQRISQFNPIRFLTPITSEQAEGETVAKTELFETFLETNEEKKFKTISTESEIYRNVFCLLNIHSSFFVQCFSCLASYLQLTKRLNLHQVSKYCFWSAI